MEMIDRRKLISAILCGAGSAMVLAPEAIAAMPIDTNFPKGFDDFVEKAQTVVVHSGRRRRRRWVCWWHRGRRVCGWRWV
jgi:hypothetical protein